MTSPNCLRILPRCQWPLQFLSGSLRLYLQVGSYLFSISCAAGALFQLFRFAKKLLLQLLKFTLSPAQRLLYIWNSRHTLLDFGKIGGFFIHLSSELYQLHLKKGMFCFQFSWAAAKSASFVFTECLSWGYSVHARMVSPICFCASDIVVGTGSEMDLKKDFERFNVEGPHLLLQRQSLTAHRSSISPPWPPGSCLLFLGKNRAALLASQPSAKENEW